MIDKLNTHYSMTNPASVYDEESLTALELAGRTTAKVNEVVESQNNHMEETKQHLNAQDKDIENQKTVVIPATIQREVQKYINNGEFDKAIDLYAGELEKRLNNLLGTVSEGSTTLDAELIDGRLDYKGNTHTNIGEHIREVSSQLSSELSSENAELKGDLEPYQRNVKIIQNYVKEYDYGYMWVNSSGIVSKYQNADTATVICELADVFKTYTLNSYALRPSSSYITDANMKIIDNIEAYRRSGDPRDIGYVFDFPQNAKYVCITTTSQNIFVMLEGDENISEYDNSNPNGNPNVAKISDYPMQTPVKIHFALPTNNQKSVTKVFLTGNSETDTLLLQNAINSGGYIEVEGSGVYIVNPLKLGSDITLNFAKNITLKLADNSRNYLFTNKDYANGNSNIRIIGGTFDINRAGGNVFVGKYSDGLYCGFGLHFYNVTNLELANVTVKNAEKYAISIVNASNVHVDNIYFNTYSDGIHFQPPIYNCKVSRVSGITADDLVSFTLGDYNDFEVSKEGNFENILVRDAMAVASGDSRMCPCVLKITGAGENNNYYFKNCYFENIGGVAEKVAYVIPDSLDGNTSLTAPIVKNMVFDNCGNKFSTSENQNSMSIQPQSGDLTFRNMKFNSTISFWNATLSRVEFINCESDNHVNIATFSNNCNIEEVVIDRVNISDNSSTEYVINIKSPLTSIVYKNSIISSTLLNGLISVSEQYANEVNIMLLNVLANSLNEIIEAGRPAKIKILGCSINSANGVQTTYSKTNSALPTSLIVCGSDGTYKIGNKTGDADTEIKVN